ncbi:MAG: hypothetical protein J6386_23705 [Candidatus Synoicihabitans palmerolidicus]|nr:hypothetical protein [Candidatus Synoicihabitans palmerolidicus]
MILYDAGDLGTVGRHVKGGEGDVFADAEVGAWDGPSAVFGGERITEEFLPVGDQYVDFLFLDPFLDLGTDCGEGGPFEEQGADALAFGHLGLFDEDTGGEIVIEAGFIVAGGGKSDTAIAEGAEASEAESSGLALVVGDHVDVSLEVVGLDLDGGEIGSIEFEFHGFAG